MAGRMLDPQLVAFGDAIRRARRAADLSQEALAHRAGTHANHVSAIERGTKDVRLTTVFRLARALERPACELLRPGADAAESAGGACAPA